MDRRATSDAAEKEKTRATSLWLLDLQLSGAPAVPFLHTRVTLSPVQLIVESDCVSLLFSERQAAIFSFFIRTQHRPQKKKFSTLLSSVAAAPLPRQRRRSVLVRAVEPPKADAKPGLELAKSGNSFAAVKDIEAIQEVLPHR